MIGQTKFVASCQYIRVQARDLRIWINEQSDGDSQMFL